MNVSNGIDNLAQLFTQDSVSARTSTSSAVGKHDSRGATQADTSSLSAAASQLAQSVSVAALPEDVRTEKVASIQNALAAGAYHVPVSDVAKKIIDTLLVPER